MTTIVCASANPGKVAELSSLLSGVVEFLPRPAGVPDVIEDADTLEGNARLKAEAIWRATGRSALADDTALEVDVLGGAPGVRTARFAGEAATDAQNRSLLLDRLIGVDEVMRTARLRTVVVLQWAEGDAWVTEGVCEGRIASSERGDRGFGYDRLFVPGEGSGLTFAQMSEAEKNRVSHRGRALRSLIAMLTTNPR